MEFDPKPMDDAALEAEKELSMVMSGEDLSGDTQYLLPGIDYMIDWWDRWYMKAGHKRLGRTLASMAKELPDKEDK